MIHLYIDTNVYLTFYHLTKDDLVELRKLYVLIKKKKIKLYLPQQTIDEFKRNRDVKIADALKKLKEEKLPNQFPQFCKGYEEFEVMKKAIKEYTNAQKALLSKLTDDIFNDKLAADDVIEKLFEIADKFEIEDNTLAVAKKRYDLGRPPGKNKSYGDAVNWEILLKNVDKHEDLHFVSEDKDYYSEIDSSYFNQYLLSEWSEKKDSDIVHYKRMSEFFKDKFPDINIASDYEKSLLLDQLTKSGSFAKSRATLEKLNDYDNFSRDQMTDLVRAMVTNMQVWYIKDDEDIKEIVKNLIELNVDNIDPALKADLDAKYKYTLSIKPKR